MTCQEALELLYDIIDKEASEIDTQEVKKHLSQCKHCADVYRIERSINELIKERLASQNQTSPQVESLRARVIAQLDSIDGAECTNDQADVSPSKKKTEPTFRIGRALAFAAAIVIVISGAFYGGQFIKDKAPYYKLEQSHWHVSDNVTNFQDEGVTVSARQIVNHRAAYNLYPTVGDFELIGGRMEQIDGVQTAHFVYRDGNRMVSVFIALADQFHLPEELLKTAVTKDNIEFYDHHCRGCRLVYHLVGNAVIVTATNERDVDLLKFLPGHTTA